jgi:hypothetical protein
VTPTKLIEQEVEILAPSDGDMETILRVKAQGIFVPGLAIFINELAEAILSDNGSRQYPDVIAFALWCRNLEVKKEFASNSHRLGRGLVFHITPGNVPINFAYSLITGLISGNVNIVRLPSKNFEQISYLVSKINSILDIQVHEDVRNRFILIRYPREKSINDFFSALCDVRVIWGGNQSINEIRTSQIPAKSFDITFADRFSFCAINSKAYIKSKDKVKIAQGFYNDTYLFDQNACTAPHLITWIGEKESCIEASEIFWSNMEPLTSRRYSIEPIQIMDKLVATARFSAQNPGATLVKSPDKKIFRFKLPLMHANLDNFKSPSGLFYEVNLLKLDELVDFIGNKYQTMTYFGFGLTELNNFINILNPRGIDRMVPIGESLDFSFVWDGHDLLNTLSRRITVAD